MKTKILLLILFLGVLNLAFALGSSIYFAKKIKTATVLNGPPPQNGLSINVVDFVGQNFALSFEDKEIPIAPEERKRWLEPYHRAYTDREEYRINGTNITSYLENLAKDLNSPPLDARFEITEGKIGEFAAAKSGKILNIPETSKNIAAALLKYSTKDTPTKNPSPKVVMDTIQPKITLDKVNDLGINTLLGRGESDFGGSSRYRASNIKIASKIMSGILIKPDAEFSFNETIGPIDGSTGYLRDLVIKNGQIIPEYGGGVCQVSTTLFRAAALAGLPILERHPHSLPVRYYNPQGFDATIYPGSVDLRFKNDTPAYILIQSKVEGSKLYFEIYGTKDGRKVTLDGPHQYDLKPDGSLKATLARTINYPGGQERKDVFKSSYRSPSAFPTIRNPLE